MADPQPPHVDAATRSGPILPAEDGRDAALSFAIAVICALAALAVLIGVAADRTVGGWQQQLRSSATVQVRPHLGETGSEAAARAAEALAGAPGVLEARALERGAAVKLLEPWLGKDGVPDDLPIPQLVTVELDPRHPPTREALAAVLTRAGVDGDVDDHARWLRDIQRTAWIVRLAALGMATALAATAGAIIGFAARSGLAARREVVEVLHLSGAEDRYIAGLVQARFGRMAAIAGLQGILPAAAIWMGAGLIAGRDEFAGFLPQRWTDILLILPAPALAGIIGAISARGSALSTLRSADGHGAGGAG